MTPILGFLILISIAFIGKVLISPRIRQNHPLILGLSASGIPYILIGVLMGPYGFDVLSKPILRDLHPLISLALGWVGFLFGIQLQWRNIRRFPGNYLLFTTVQSLVSMGVIVGVVFAGLQVFTPMSVSSALEIAVVLGIVGSMTAPMALARMVISRKLRGKVVHLAQFVSSLDAFWGIVMMGLFFVFRQSILPSGITIPWVWLVLILLLGVGIGLSFVLLLRVRFESEEMLLLILGLVIFVSGIGFYLQISPIFLTMIVGIVIAQFPFQARRISRVLMFAEKPIYLMMLIFAGAWWNFHAISHVVVILLFLIARLMGKMGGGWFASRVVDCGFPVPPSMGTILLAFGGVSLAIAFNFLLFNINTAGDMVISATIIGIIVFDELAMWGTLRLYNPADTPVQ